MVVVVVVADIVRIWTVKSDKQKIVEVNYEKKNLNDYAIICYELVTVYIVHSDQWALLRRERPTQTSDSRKKNNE